MLSYSSFSQVGIGTVSVDPSAMLQIESTSQGLLIPKVTTSERNSISASASPLSSINALLVFDTDTISFWYHNGTIWIELSSSSTEKIGVIAAFATNLLPSGWMALDGSTLPDASYPEIVSVYPYWSDGTTITLPDYRGYFLRGSGTNGNGISGLSPGTKQNNGTAIPNNPFSTDTAGDHSHSDATTSTSGNHSHSYVDSAAIGTSAAAGGNNPVASTSAAGRFTGSASHSHTVSITASGDHTHTFTGGGDSETSPQNVSLVWAVKVK